MAKLKDDIYKLIRAQQWKDLESLILQSDEKELLHLVKQSILMKEGKQCLVGVLTSLECKTRESTAFKLKLYEKLLIFCKYELDSQGREQGDVVSSLMMHAENFPSNCLVKLIDTYLKHIESDEPFEGEWTDLLSKLIMLSATRKDLVVDGKEICGEDYRSEVLSTICSFKWCSQTASTLLPVIKDLNLPKEELKDVLDKIRKVLDEIDYQSIPPVVYHLVLLGQGKFPGVVLELIMDYFNKQVTKQKKNDADELSDDIAVVDDSEKIEGNNSESELTEAQSTVVLHIIHLAQYDPALVKDYIRVIRGSTWLPQRIFSPFNLALTLSLAYIDRYRDQIIDSMKSCILRHFRLEEKRKKSFWLRETFKDHFDLTARFRETVNNCKGGWDQVSQGLVYLCFSLLESGGGFKSETYPSQQCVSLACNVLPLILKKEPHLAPSILKQLSGFILTASAPMQYIDLLGKLVRMSPLVMLDHVDIIRELLEQLSYLPLSVAGLLLQVLLPLLKISMTLKDALILILRKMLFSKRVESRQAAVQGFLQFLRHFKVMGVLPASQGSLSFSSTLSQISADIHTTFDSSTNEALCLELLGVLRRCFSQQHEVRSTLYAGLYDICRANPKLSVPVLSVLHQHLTPFLDLGPHALNPILVQKTVTTQGETVTLVEPIGELLVCLSQCKTWYEAHYKDSEDIECDEDEDSVLVLNNICSVFDVLSEKLAHCDMDDMDFGSASFSSLTPTGKQNLLYAELMVGVYDALIDQNFCNGALHSEDKMKIVVALFKTQRKVVDIIRENSKVVVKKAEGAGKKGECSGKKGKGLKSKGRPPSNIKSPAAFKSSLSLKIAAEILSLAFKGDETADKKCVEMLQNNYDLQIYMLSVVNQAVAELKSMIPSARDRVLLYLKMVAHLLLGESYRHISSGEMEGTRNIAKLNSELTTLHSLISAFMRFYKNQLPNVFKDIAGKSSSVPYDALLQKIVKKCQIMLLNIFKDDDQNLIKAAAIIIQIMNLVIQEMDYNSEEFNTVHDWIDQLCRDQTAENPAVTESLLNLLFSLHDQQMPKKRLALDIGREIHYRLGDIEEDISVEECGTYKVITEASAHTAVAVVMNYCDDVLSLLELTLQKIRASTTAGMKVEGEVEPNICKKFASIIQALHEIIKTSLPQGASLDMVLKTTTKIYNTLTLFVRYYLDYFKVTTCPQISEKFEKLVHLSANLLKEHVFKMIKYVNNAYLENSKKSQLLTARAIKESRLIPAMVFSMELYEKLLIQLGKKSSVNLMASMKTSTSRDFRIKQECVEALQREREAEEDQSDAENDGEEGDEEREGKTKRMKVPPRKKKKSTEL